MDASKKSAIEQRLVIGLAIGLVAVVIAGPAKSLGLFASRPRVAPPAPAAPGSEKVHIAQSFSAIVQEHMDQMRPDAQVAASQVKPPPGPPPMYTAQDLRDPLESLLPRTVALQTGGTAILTPTSQAPLSAPPELRVKGIVWGNPQAQAIINDQVYGVDDMIGDAKILSINHQGITVEHQGTRIFYSVESTLPPTERGVSRQAHQWR